MLAEVAPERRDGNEFAKTTQCVKRGDPPYGDLPMEGDQLPEPCRVLPEKARIRGWRLIT
jgi:hypothetical protein